MGRYIALLHRHVKMWRHDPISSKKVIMPSGGVWAGHMQIIIIIGGDLQTTRVLVDKGIIVIIPAKKAPLPPRKKYKGRGDSSAGRRHAGTGAVGVVGSRLVLRLFRRGFREAGRGFREAGATADAVLVALKKAADCKKPGLHGDAIKTTADIGLPSDPVTTPTCNSTV